MIYSLDYAAETIYDSTTKEYFKEALETYQTENYRSSVVMLYTVVLCDLLYKLQDLRDLYSDDTANQIPKKIEQHQVTNPKSPEWENILVDEIKQRTSLLELSDLTNIEPLIFRQLNCCTATPPYIYRSYINSISKKQMYLDYFVVICYEAIRRFIGMTQSHLMLSPQLYNFHNSLVM